MLFDNFLQDLLSTLSKCLLYTIEGTFLPMENGIGYRFVMGDKIQIVNFLQDME